MSSRETGHGTRLDIGFEERAVGNSSDETPSVESPSFDEVVRTLFDVNEGDLETLQTIREDPGATTSDIAAVVDRDRSNVNRSVSLLEEIGLVVRQRRVMKAGGYFYEHYAEPVDEVEERLVAAVEQWAVGAVDAITEREWEHEPDPLSGTPGRE